MPLIVYSPGLGGGLDSGSAFAEAWRAAGFAVATIGHPGSDDSLWRVARGQSLVGNIRAALAAAQYALRARDCERVAAALVGGLADARVDADRIGMAGHSFGAHIVQRLAADLREREDGGRQRARDPHKPAFVAALAISPGARTPAAAAELRRVRIPFFCITGAHDGFVTLGRGVDALTAGMPLARRIAVYQALPPGARQLLVLTGADHMALAGSAVEPLRYSRSVPAADDAAIWRRIAAATTAFWQRHLAGGGDTEPRAAYAARVHAGLDPRDRFEVG